MDFAYSPSRDPGGTLHLSPAHVRHVDSLSTMRKFRRSLSRSPSKPYLTVSRSPSQSPFSSSHTPTATPLQPVPEYTSPAVSQFTQFTQFGLPCPPSAKKLRPNLRRTTPLRVSTTSTPPSRIPVRRGLSDSNDQGNATPAPMRRHHASSEEQENSSSSVSPEDNEGYRCAVDDPSLKLNVSVKKSSLFPPQNKAMAGTAREMGRSSKSSPLKRSDGVMNLDRAYQGSPSAKRKSVCGGFTSSPFDIAHDEHVQAGQDNDHRMDESDDEDVLQDAMNRSPLAPRFTSLRKSTLQHRTSERSAAFRARRSVDGTSDVSRSPKAQVKVHPRTSLDSALPTMHTFACSSSNDPDLHTRDVPRLQYARPSRPNPHPLSQALSPISPSPCRQHDGPANEAPRFQIPAIPVINFARSLPIGALRPNAKAALHKESQNLSLATPETYKIARPDPAAFRSTGLISKRHRNPDDIPAPPPNQLGMPDTPCKKFPVGFAFPTSPTPISTSVKPRFAQPEFGTPSKPFNMYQAKPTPLSLGKSASVFGSTSTFPRGNNRRESFASVDGEEVVQSPTGPTDSQSSADELPPTPTKQVSGLPLPKPPSLRSSIFGRQPTIGPNTFLAPDAAEQQALQPSSLFAQPSRSNIQSRHSPKTPADTTFPDASNLSISPRNYIPVSPVLHLTSAGVMAPPPETPTHREGSTSIGNLLMTPSNHGMAHDVDLVLLSKFKKVEYYGSGEFSEVYKVFGIPESASPQSYFSSSFGSKSSQTPLPDKIWIVKRTKVPYASLKAREKRLHEVSIMQSIGKSDHVVQLVNSWEAYCHLYIQTEFCEEGDLEGFLARTGRKGRLDDFRIWKIMIELCSGVKHIHDSGFIHLDLKPANIFIDFEGVLKIGDFGMASGWPASSTTESEGDRRYMGPDLLLGQFDKPADIFALGMMMFEIAGNCLPPHNGASWQQLRSGDWSELPSLTCGSSNSLSQISDNELVTNRSFDDFADVKSHGSLNASSTQFGTSALDLAHLPNSTPRNLGYEDEAQPPNFMLDPQDEGALDQLVHWMMQPEPMNRPVVDQILSTSGVQWVQERRRAGAVVFEGTWGPPNHVLKCHEPEDAVMLDAP